MVCGDLFYVKQCGVLYGMRCSLMGDHVGCGVVLLGNVLCVVLCMWYMVWCLS